MSLAPRQSSKHRALSLTSFALACGVTLAACSDSSDNQAPIIKTENIDVPFEQKTEFVIQAEDQEQDPLQFELIKAPSKGVLTLSNSGLLTFTPDPSQTETETIQVRVSDGHQRVNKEITLTFVDPRPFVLTQFSPQNETKYLATNTRISLDFNSVLAPIPNTNGTCESAILLQTVNDPNTCIGYQLEIADHKKSLTIRPSEALQNNTRYQVVVTNKLSNFVSRALADEVNFEFSTAHDDVVISEVKLDRHFSGVPWLEIYNGTSEPKRLSDYHIETDAVNEFGDQLGRKQFALPEAELAQGEYLVIQNDTASYSWQRGFENGPGIVIVGKDGTRMFWHNQGSIRLFNKTKAVDSVHFGQVEASFDELWSGAAITTDDNNTYLTRDKAVTDSNTASDWTLSQFPTAGALNDVTCQLDGDKDGIPDCSEQEGKTYAGLPLYDWGARTDRADVFVEIDYMKSGDMGVIPQYETLEKVKEAFDQQGISVHFDVGGLFKNTLPDQLAFDLGGGQQVPFATSLHFADSPQTKSLFQYKHQYFDLARRNLFHYVLFAHSQNVDGSAGSSGYAEINGNDVIVTLGNWGLSRDTEASLNYLINIQSSTLMHELGHNFGLYHGGNDNVNNKPNHLSVMNYMYQLQGLPTIGTHEGDRVLWRLHPFNDTCTRYQFYHGPEQDYRLFSINYSHGLAAPIDESMIDEHKGLGHPESKPVDFNCSGQIDPQPIALDYNFDGWLGQVFYDHDEWSNLNLQFNRDAGSNASYAIPPAKTSSMPLLELTPTPRLLESIKRANLEIK